MLLVFLFYSYRFEEISLCDRRDIFLFGCPRKVFIYIYKINKKNLIGVCWPTSFKYYVQIAIYLRIYPW